MTARESSWGKKEKELNITSVGLKSERQLLQMVKCILKLRLVLSRSLTGLRMLATGIIEEEFGPIVTEKALLVK
jgi:hypothetical protein